ncbi:probable carboxylesterase 17 [Salvia miltiorrhiza]|uniref:probable carboxylesterase 17 n=1 Tax=Salvia miltiorrhiza TaxID=226208 RepID=UPI0025ABF3E9|nr:probable carboxylesterase 17 [Salvia miltiorrhiza]
MSQEKKVVERVSGWLRVFDDGSVDRTWTGPPEVKFMMDPVPPHDDFIDGVAVADATTDAGLKIRIYSPERRDADPKKLPVLVHFHGGGFCLSDADWHMYYTVYTRLSREARAIVVSPYLRQAPEHRLPAACDDGFAALVWLSSVARGGAGHPWLDGAADFGRVFLIGDSSGGNIVHQVAARAGDEDLSPLKLAGAVPIHTDFCRTQRSKSEMEKAETPFLTPEMMDKLFAMALPEGATKEHPITCPMGEAAAPLETLKLPPYLYCMADHDLVRDRELEFYEAMKKAGKEVELLTSHDVGHSFYLNKIAVDCNPKVAEETNKLFQGIIHFINNH